MASQLLLSESHHEPVRGWITLRFAQRSRLPCLKGSRAIRLQRLFHAVDANFHLSPELPLFMCGRIDAKAVFAR